MRSLKGEPRPGLTGAHTAGAHGGLVMTGRWGAATKALVSHVKGVMKAPGNQLGGWWFRE